MDRRHFISTISVGVVVGTAGCLGSNNPGGETESTPVVEGDDLELLPGENSTVDIKLEGVGSVQFSDIPDPDIVDIDVNEAEFSTSPSGQDDSYPPYWNWSPPDANTEISVPVYVADGAESGEYEYTVSAWNVDVEEGADRAQEEPELETHVISVIEE